jgi:hypothetical protein
MISFVRNFFKKYAAWLRRLALLFTTIVVVVFLLGSSSALPGTDVEEQVRAYTRDLEFDYVGWMLDAMRIKLFEGALGTESYLSDQARHKLVSAYIELIAQIQRIEWEIQTTYADPSIEDPAKASEKLHQQLDSLLAMRDRIAPVAESILQSQISVMVDEMGLDAAGQPFPPVLYHSTPPPPGIVVSPRNIIRQDAFVSLTQDIPIDQRAALEERVDKALDVSSLVVGIGGVGVYPTMVAQTSNLDWLSEVIAHEWTHNYLNMRPLGINYIKNPELRIMNETTASIAGKEIGRAVIARYYPELLPPPQPSQKSQPVKPSDPPAFNFNKEMHQTRVQVDQLLADGKIAEAEAYMEARRKIFWDNGYHGLRKLNQAYFAFNGAYADEPEGPAGTDPVGAAVRALRAQSSTLADFVNTIAWMTSFEQLKQAVEKAE